ncbi:MAG: Gfo/Idh/MocA family oxidoreductase [Pseudomonadota bacterium]
MSIEGRDDAVDARPLRLGMVGGGHGAFIGAVHRMAARLDGRYDLVAGALSSRPDVARASGADLGIAPDRAYDHFEEMAAAEASREDGIEVVAIVTPNHLHFAACKAFLENGVHVICDKPLVVSMSEAVELEKLVEQSGLVFTLTQNNTGYPMVRQAREMIGEGMLGSIRVIRVSYVQDWLTTAIERDGQKQAAWRMDPAQAGAGGAIADIGVHAYNLAEFMTGLTLESVCADLQSFGEGRSLDDNANVLLRYEGGARGTLWATQVAPGNNNALTIGVYGDKGGLEWSGEANDYLRYTPLGQPPQMITRGGPGASAAAANATRMPAGHPEGYIEGFGNLYARAADLIQGQNKGGPLTDDELPGIAAGLSGMRFIAACLASNRDGGCWTSVQDIGR